MIFNVLFEFGGSQIIPRIEILNRNSLTKSLLELNHRFIQIIYIIFYSYKT